MEKGHGKGTDTLQTDNVFTRKEYIEREAAINSLTEENLVLNLDSVMDGLSNQTKRSAHRILASLPAADVVPVVRCKDCKYSAVDFENSRYCKLVTYYNHVPDDWFCADGEKREVEHD